MATDTKCYSCDFFNGLDEVKSRFATDIYAKLAPELAGLFPTLAIAFFLFTGIRMMLDPGNAAGTFKALGKGRSVWWCQSD